jgi:hypothetical protein
MVYRTRLCFNDHKFTTKEIPVPQELIDEENRASRIATLQKAQAAAHEVNKKRWGR